MLEPPEIVTGDPAFRSLLDEVDRIARTPVSVLIEGESGTGKELVAQRLHARSDRAAKSFLAVNCAALCENLAESELFGHAAGAFTGALRERRGLFEETSGGTLFLDEVGDLSLSIQAKLLRVLQEGMVRRVGETVSRPVSFRLVAATHRNLRGEMERGRFREDLFYRIHVVKIELPPLRHRRGDIARLAARLAARFSRTYRKQVAGIREGALWFLDRYPWPGNVRELENELKRLVALVPEGGWIESHHLSPSIRGKGEGLVCESATLQEKLDALERSEIVRTLSRTGGNKTKAARELGLSRQGLKNKMARYGIGRDGGPGEEKKKESPADSVSAPLAHQG